MRVIGLISGTSMDAIDAAVVDIQDPGAPSPIALQAFITMPYPPATREALERFLAVPSQPDPGGAAAGLASLNMAIGEAFAQAALLARKEAGGDVDLIGSHGQTIAHIPRPGAGIGLHPATLQIGEAAIIAERTGITCVADFRVADIAAGGEGAPLVSYADYLLLRDKEESRAALNIGGIANVTLLPPNAKTSQVRAFDTGPGNMAIDLAMRELDPDGPGFDRNGQVAARGVVQETLLDRLLGDPYFALPPPKTAGREQFGPRFVAHALELARALSCSGDDLIATLTELTARTIAAAIPPDCRRVIASGGGVHNRTLMRMLTRALAKTPATPALVQSDDCGLPADAKEAMAFALLAHEAIRGRACNLPTATGASHQAVLGKIVPGGNFSALMQSIW